jgi:hypothetical protein
MPDPCLDIITDFHATARGAPEQFIHQHLGHPLMATAVVAGKDGNVRA